MAFSPGLSRDQLLSARASSISVIGASRMVPKLDLPLRGGCKGVGMLHVLALDFGDLQRQRRLPVRVANLQANLSLQHFALRECGSEGGRLYAGPDTADTIQLKRLGDADGLRRALIAGEGRRDDDLGIGTLLRSRKPGARSSDLVRGRLQCRVIPQGVIHSGLET